MRQTEDNPTGLQVTPYLSLSLGVPGAKVWLSDDSAGATASPLCALFGCRTDGGQLQFTFCQVKDPGDRPEGDALDCVETFNIRDSGDVRGVVVTPTLAYLGQRQRALCLDVDRGRVHKVATFNSDVMSQDVSTNGVVLLSGLRNGNACLTDVRAPAATTPTIGFQCSSGVSSCQYVGPGGHTVLACAMDGSMRLHDLRSGGHAPIMEYRGGVVSFEPDDFISVCPWSNMVAATKHWLVRVWDLASPKPIGEFSTRGPASSFVFRASWGNPRGQGPAGVLLAEGPYSQRCFYFPSTYAARSESED